MICRMRTSSHSRAHSSSQQRLAAWDALSNVQLCCIWETYVNKYFEGLLHWGKKVLLGK